MIKTSFINIIFDLIKTHFFLSSSKPQGNSTMARNNASKQKNSTNVSSPIFELLKAEYTGLITALNDVPMGMLDSGQEEASVSDMGLRVELGTLCNFFHRQNHGKIQVPVKGSDGKPTGAMRTISNNKERLDDSFKRQADIQNKNELDVDDFKTLYYLSVNEQRFEHCENMLQLFSSIYRDIFKEDWKPVTTEPVKRIIVTEEENKKWLAKLAEASKKNNTNASAA